MTILTLSKNLQQRANTELNEVADRVEDDIKHIKEWLLKQAHLKVRTDDQWLLNFLRSSKFSLERTKEKLDFFYTMRTLAPEFFENRDPLLPEIQEILKQGFILPLSKPFGDDGPALILTNWKTVDPDKHSYCAAIKTFYMIIDILLTENVNLGVAGVILLIDDEKFPMSYLLRQNPAHIRKCMLVGQTAYPVRMKGSYFFNFTPLLTAVFNLFKPFLSEKVKARINIYTAENLDDMFKTIPQSYFPTQYGGEGGSMEELAVAWKKKVECYRDWFLEDAQYRSDETRRPGKPKTDADVFGIEGSFRTLAVD